ncbi:hypothetical protein QUF80_04040 [Desulfococcaceae bacterium HSG8]|nr:hypothetical protein [Desulfococcaceae bacterium HSG8]
MMFFTSPAVPVIEQIPLIHTINEDDRIYQLWDELQREYRTAGL